MGLQKEGYKPAINGTTLIGTDIDQDGNIVTDTEMQTAVGQKKIRVTRTNAENNAAQNFYIVQTLLGFMDATAVSWNHTFDVKWSVF